MSEPQVSDRGRLAPDSPIRSLTPYADGAKSRGVHVHHLNIGQPDIATPRVMLEAYRRFDDDVIAYGPSEGFLAYRERLARGYRQLALPFGAADIRADDIVVTTGGSEALLLAFAATCDIGENIVLCEPTYPNYMSFAQMLGVEVKPVRTRVEEDFRVDPAKIRAAIDDKTRALCICSPNNPTGVALDREALSELAKICRECGLFLICDEVYREFIYDAEPGTRAPSVMSLPGLENSAVMIDSVSKRFSACGARVGAMVTRNRELRTAALRYAQARLSPPTVDQYAANAALDLPPSYAIEVVGEYQARRDALVSGLRGIGIQCPNPKGAFYLIAALPVEDAGDFSRFLLEEFEDDNETVMLAPARGFYVTEGLGANEVRIAYVLEKAKLERCVELLGLALERYENR